MRSGFAFGGRRRGRRSCAAGAPVPLDHCVECVTGQLLEKAPIFMAQQRPEEIQLALLFFFRKEFLSLFQVKFPFIYLKLIV